jgi:GcrA cell cycle regulator
MPISSMPVRLPGSNPGWTPERIEALTCLWNDGLPANQIAAKLGQVTRNAVIGKVHRLGLPGRKTTSRPPRRTSPRRNRAGRVSMRKPAPLLRSYPAAPDDLPPALAAAMLSVAQLTDATCHWPIGDPHGPGFGFCGARNAAGRQPYCAAHQRIGHDRGAGR